jgi:alanine racemase
MFSLLRKKYQNLNKVLVSQSALKHNYLALSKFNYPAKIAPVLKSNSYGHGLKIAAKIFDKLSSPFLIVDSLYEAYELKKLNLETPILIIGYTHPSNFLVKKIDFHFTVFDLETARALNKKQKNCQVHIFVDTGMSREGVTLSELDNFIKEIKKFKNLKVVGLASHLADADNAKNQNFTENQISNFKKALEILEKNNIYPKWRHISASGGAFKIKDKTFNLIRAGLASYGINPLDFQDKYFNKLNLKPVLSFVSSIAQIKKININNCVGYNCTFIAKKEMKIGIVPAGYYDGVDRRLSNKGVVLVNNKECPILGRVSMNITVIDLSKVKDAKIGDEVVLISSNLKDKNSLVNLAKTCRTIPYELMVHLAESLKREVVE